MKTLYKSTPRIAAAILGIMALSTSAAVALTSNQTPTEIVPQGESLGRFVVTPGEIQFVAPPEKIGRFVVSKSGTIFVPAEIQKNG